MGKFSPLLLKKPEVILLSKTDLLNKEEISKKALLLKQGQKVLAVSIHDWESLENLKSFLGRGTIQL